MKIKLILLILAIGFSIVSGQNIIPHRGIIQEVYNNDTVKFELQGDALNITGSQSELQVMGSALALQEDSSRWKAFENDSSIIFSDLRILTGESAEIVSRTIYVSIYTGNDTTGTGETGAKFRTVGKALEDVYKYIDSGDIVTIQIDSGTYILTPANLYTISLLQGAGSIKILGTTKLIESGFTMGSAQAIDPLTYAVSGGNTATWDVNEWKYYFLKSSTSYYPITHNTTTTISITQAVTGTEIYQNKTIINLNLTENTVFPSFIEIDFSFVILNITNFALTIGNPYQFIIDNSNLIGSNTITFDKKTVWKFHRNTSNGLTIEFQNQNLNLSTANYLYGNKNSQLLIYSYSPISNVNFANWVFENPNTGTSSACILYSGGSTSVLTNAHYIKFVNSNIAIRHFKQMYADFSLSTCNIILSNVNYLIKRSATITGNENNMLNIDYTRIFGAPVTRYFFDTQTEFVNLTKGRNIQITGLIYPEQEQPEKATIANNGVTNIQIGDSLQNTSIEIDYTAIRGDSVEYGKITVVNKMAKGLVLSETTPLGSDAGLTFSVSFIAPKKINLAITTTNTAAGTMNYTIKRKLRTPITL
jgi:hypothetical protein